MGRRCHHLKHYTHNSIYVPVCSACTDRYVTESTYFSIQLFVASRDRCAVNDWFASWSSTGKSKRAVALKIRLGCLERRQAVYIATSESFRGTCCLLQRQAAYTVTSFNIFQSCLLPISAIDNQPVKWLFLRNLRNITLLKWSAFTQNRDDFMSTWLHP